MSAFSSTAMPADRASDLAAALDGSACLGAWTHDLPADRFTAAQSLGSALALAPEEAVGAPLARVLSGIHAEDRQRIECVLHAAWESGGPFEAEFRTWADHGRVDANLAANLPGSHRGTEPGGSRWLRLMGRAEIDESRRILRIRGLAFDLTEGRLGHGTSAQQTQRQVNQLADHVIAMKGLVAGLDNPPLAQLVDRMAVEIGVELARCLMRAQGGRRH